MSPPKNATIAAAVALMFLTSCDPGVHIGWTAKFDIPVDQRCVEETVRSTVGNAKTDEYVSEGILPFPKGVEVHQIWYDLPYKDGLPRVSYGYRIEIGKLPEGPTGYQHLWGKLGTSIPLEERNYVLPMMAKVNASIARNCGVSVGNGLPEQGKG